MYFDEVTGAKWTACGADPCNACKNEFFADLKNKGLMGEYKKKAEEWKWTQYRKEQQAEVKKLKVSAVGVTFKGKGKQKPSPLF